MIGRRAFLKNAMAAGTASLFTTPRARAAEAPLETTRVRLYKFPGICLAPQYIAEELLQAEGFTDVQYLDFPEGMSGVYDRLASGAIDFTQWYGVPFIEEIDKGRPIVFLAGVHTGCIELVTATPRVKSIRDLKDRTIATSSLSPTTSILAAMLAHVGLDHRKDVRFVEHTPSESVELLAAGKIDAFMALPPIAQEIRARKIGHALVATALDRPWSQYFCCMLVGNKDFVATHPVAAKRVLRAIFKADQLCATEPERVARSIVDRGFTKRYDYALQTLKDVPYGKARQYDPEDMVRFYSLRLREAGLVKGTPQKIIAQGTDWRFLNELKKELKG
jgi:NitT/TauT family transport system substrate-binding protein